MVSKSADGLDRFVWCRVWYRHPAVTESSGLAIRRIQQAAQQVWALIVDRLHQPTWRLDVTKVESAASPNGKPRWKETMSNGMVVTMEERELDPVKMLVVDIADPDLPFGGTWTYQLSATANGSRLQITEDGFVKPPMYRFFMIFMDPASTMTKYLTFLGRKLGETVTPQAVN